MTVSLLDVLQKLMAIHNVSVTEHKSPFMEDDIDLGIRKTFFKDFNWTEMAHNLNKRFESHSLYILQDVFDVYYAVYITDKSNRTAIVIGPYRYTGLSFNKEDYLKKGFSENEVPFIKEYILKIPHIHEDVITQQINAVLSTVESDISFSIKHLRETKVKGRKYNQFSFVYNETRPVQMMDKVQHRYDVENEILTAVAMGNITRARKGMEKFGTEDITDRYTSNALMKKKSLIILNTLFRKAVEKANVHPYYIDEISYRFFQKIDLVTDTREYTKLIEEMLIGYCEYVKKYSYEQYSDTVRKALNHIHSNIENKLSLNDIALHLKLTPSHIARQFHSETGKTVVEYINYTRIVIAANRLKQSPASIADTAASVGIHDTNYFSRIFKKYMGCSPSEYRR